MIPVLVLLSFAPATCDRTDHRCQAERYTSLAGESRRAGDHADRALRLYLAHREYLYLFDVTGEPGALCGARAALDEARTIEPLPTHLIDRLGKSALEVSARARKAKVECAPHSKAARARRTAERQKVGGGSRPSPVPPADDDSPRTGAIASLASSTGSASPTMPSPASPNTEMPADAVPSPSSPGPGAPIEDAVPPKRLSTVALIDADTSPAWMRGDPSPGAPLQAARPPDRRGRALVIAGGVMLSAGLGLGAAAGVMGHGLLATREAADKLHSMTDHPTDEQRAQDQALWQEYQRTGSRTLAVALAGGTSVVIAAILLGVGGKRMARAASHAVLTPTPGGLAVRMKF